MMIADTTMSVDATMIADATGRVPLHLLKNEAIDRLDSVVNDIPKYKKNLEKLMVDFIIDDMLRLINIIDRDKEFKTSRYYRRYSVYFDEIEDLIHTYF